MKKLKFIGLVLVVCILTTPLTAWGHSGRTDSSGGHKDNKNASGLGYYHYHHGYPAHLHTNGVCPYESKNNTVNNSNVKSTQKPKPFVPSIVGTDIRTYINGYEVPTWAYNGTNPCAVIIAEDLKDYGFDVSWDGYTRTLEVKRNDAKAITPIPMESYRNLPIGVTAFNIIANNDVKIVLKDDVNTYIPGAIFNLGGYMAISVDELKMFGNFVWDGYSRTVKINNR
jgi:hypothetical protein